MFVGVRIFVVCGKAKVDEVNDVWLFWAFEAEKKIFRFDVSIDEAAIMDGLDSIEKLEADHEGRFEAEPLTTQFKEVFEVRAKKFKDHTIIGTTTAEVVNLTLAFKYIVNLCSGSVQ